MRILVVLALLIVTGASSLRAEAVGWGNLDALVLGAMPQVGTVQESYWMPDHPDPSVSRTALAFVYAHIPGSAGSVSLDAGLFVRDSAGWRMERKLQGIYGHAPRDVIYLGDRIELTTTTLGPNEPRCCPTQVTRYSIARSTGAVTRLP
jgi:hypothetical protein